MHHATLPTTIGGTFVEISSKRGGAEANGVCMAIAITSGALIEAHSRNTWQIWGNDLAHFFPLHFPYLCV